MSIESVFRGDMSWNEAWLLFTALVDDPSSYVGAALADMDYPITREAIALADLFDLEQRVNTPKRQQSRVKPYPRPFRLSKGDQRKSQRPELDQAAIDAALADRGHHR